MKKHGSLSPFGKLVRKIRVDHDETQGVMAKKLRTGPTYLCIIEHGKYPVPKGIIPALVKQYSLDKEMEKELYEAAAKQQRHSKINLEHCDEEVRQFVSKLTDAVNNSRTVTKTSLDKILADITC